MISKNLQYSVISTLAIFQAEERSALTLDEICQFLHKTDGGPRVKPSKSELLDCLIELGKNDIVFKEDGYYSLGKENIAPDEIARRKEISAQKIAKNKWPLWFLRFVPFARSAAVTGSVAFNNARSGSDLDLLIISAPGRIWTTRFFALLATEIFGRRRENQKKTEKICLNYFLTGNAPSPVRNLASANLFSSAVPVFGADYFHDFLRQNDWIEKFIYQNSRETPPNERLLRLRKIMESCLSGKTGNRLERALKKWQKKRLEKKITAQTNMEHFVLTDEALMLHSPEPKNVKVIGEYISIMNRFKNI